MIFRVWNPTGLLAAPKLDAVAAVQAGTIISFSRDIVTFAISFKEVGFMGPATSRYTTLGVSE